MEKGDSKYEYRRDSSDNVHVVYNDPQYRNKAFEGYIPPRYTEQDNLKPVPVPPAAPVTKAMAAPAVLPPNEPLPQRKIMGLKRRTFFIALVMFALIVLGVAIGAGVGVAAATRKHNRSNQPYQSAAPVNFGTTVIYPASSVNPTTIYVIPAPAPTTLFTSVVTPTSTPLPITHCQQMWEGTSPFCDGKCDSGWTVVRQQALADSCDKSTDTVIIDSCANLSPNSCLTGDKVLCQKCETDDPGN